MYTHLIVPVIPVKYGVCLQLGPVSLSLWKGGELTSLAWVL